MARLSRRAGHIDTSGIRKVFDLAAGLSHPVDFSIGQPDFDVPRPVVDAAVDAMNDGFNRYTVTQGIRELHERLRRHLAETRGFEPEATLITSGVSGALLLAALVLIDPGDEVIIPDPYFVMYPHLARLAGGVPVFADTYPDFRVTAARIEPLVTERTKVLVLNSPSNPTGAVSTAAELAEIADLVRGRDVLVITDEIYDAFSYDGPFASISSVLEGVLLVGGMSKSHAMTGWRLGWAAGPADVVGEMTKLQQYTFVCAPSFAQRAALAAFDAGVSREVAGYRARRDFMVGALSEDFEIAGGEGAFYLFPRVPESAGGDFVERAVAAGCLIIPGHVFSARRTNFRISYATSMEDLERGAELLVGLARKGRVRRR